MEYEQFYKFLEHRPVQELNDCVHRIVNMVGSRFQELKSPQASQNGSSTHLGTETVRVESIKKLIVKDSFLLPHGMSGYHKTDLRFIRWFPGYHGPVPNPNTFSLEHKVPTDWFLDKELQVWLNWNTDGYFEMSRKDSLKFNQNNSANKTLVEEARHTNNSNAEKRKTESVTGSVDRKRSRGASLAAPNTVTPTPAAPKFKYLTSSSESEKEDEDGHMMVEPTDIQPPLVEKKSSEVTLQDAERELIRQNSPTSSSTAIPFTPPPTPTTPSKPIKGDTVYITAGRYVGSEGTVMGGNEKAYRVQIPNLADPGSTIAQVPPEMVTLVRPTASCTNTADPSESYLSALKRVSDRPRPKPLSQLAGAASTSTASPAPSTVHRKEEANQQQKRAKVHPRAQDNHEDKDKDKDSVDEFFNYLASSDIDYFSDQYKSALVGDSSTSTGQAKTSPLAVPHTTPSTPPNVVPTVSQSSEVSAGSVAPGTDGAPDGSFPTESLTTPPDMVREEDTVSSLGMNLEMEGEKGDEKESGDKAESRANSPPLDAGAATATKKEKAAASPEDTYAQTKSHKHRVGRPKKRTDGSYSKAWSFKCKCGEKCSSYENPLYHPVGQWFECSECSVWSHVQCLLGNASITQVQEMEEVLCFSCKSKVRRNRSGRGQSVDTTVATPANSDTEDAVAPSPRTTKRSRVKADGEVQAAAGDRDKDRDSAPKVQPSMRAESPAPPVPEDAPTQAATTTAAPQPESTVPDTVDPMVTLPVKITTAFKPTMAYSTDSASEKAKSRGHKRKAHPTSASSSPASARLLHVGQRVILLRGQHRNKEAEVIDVARAGPVVLPDIYKVRLCSGDDKVKVLQMPLEFLTKKVDTVTESDAKAVQGELSAGSSTEDRQHRRSAAASSPLTASVSVAVDTPPFLFEASTLPASEPALASAPVPPTDPTSDVSQSPHAPSAPSAATVAPPPLIELVHLAEKSEDVTALSPEDVQQAPLEVQQDESREEAPVTSATEKAIPGDTLDPHDAPVESTDQPDQEPPVHPLLRWQPNV